MIELNEKIACCELDDLIVDTYPPCRVGGGYLAADAGDLARGTVLAKNAEGKLEVLGKTEGAKAYGILADPVKSGNGEIPVNVYISGKFNRNKISAAEGYTMTEDDIDTLRAYGIELTAAMKY